MSVDMVVANKTHHGSYPDSPTSPARGEPATARASSLRGTPGGRCHMTQRGLGARPVYGPELWAFVLKVV